MGNSERPGVHDHTLGPIRYVSQVEDDADGLTWAEMVAPLLCLNEALDPT